MFDRSRSEPWVQSARAELDTLLTREELAAASRSTLNAHYTDPQLAASIWSAVGELGVTGGQVLEPGCGAGTFIGSAPDSVHMLGIELEPTTAGIAAALHPQDEIRAESFAQTQLATSSVDAVIGNVPFGAYQLHDPRDNPQQHSIHNHFLLKSLRAVKPGGIVAVITSRWTLDAANPAARADMADTADLLGAVRLPNRAHRTAAGTDVLTDVLLLRRREDERSAAGADWLATHTLQDGLAAGQRINTYFAQHPDMVLGTLGSRRGAYGHELTVTASSGALAQQLTSALSEITSTAAAAGLTAEPQLASQHQPAGEEHSSPAAQVGGRVADFDDYLSTDGRGRFWRSTGGQQEQLQVPRSQQPELAELLALRDTTVALLEAEAASSHDTSTISQLREQLGQQYARYHRTHGPINRFSWRRTGHADPTTGQERWAKVRPPQGGFRQDPFAPTVQALEHFDTATHTASRADIFHQRVIAPPRPQRGADTPGEALAITRDRHGEVELTAVRDLLGLETTSHAREQLGTLVFADPDDGGALVPAEAYLSGNVRTKLAAAERAAETDPDYQTNVDALREVLPVDLGPAEIDVRLGASWVPAEDVQTFLQETLEDDSISVEHPGGSLWTVRGGQRTTVLASSSWGTERRSAPELAESLLGQSPIRVEDPVEEGSRRKTLNPTETIAAQEKADELNSRFAEWVWEDPDRARRLATVYNERFNALVLRSYDSARLALPGLAASFAPRPHQTAAVARMVSEPAVLLDHQVGAGKTASMVMGTRELRRLGLAQKPAIVVPNHMLEQFSREYLQLYPQANVLAATTEDLSSAERRRRFAGRCATGDWDAVILTRSAFERIPMSPQGQADYQAQESERLRNWLETSRDSGGLSVKRLEKQLAAAEERVKKRLDSAKDAGISFEATGIDYLVVDEAHGYKNLRTPSTLPGVTIEGSQRAEDLAMKLDWLRDRGRRHVATFATATPIANSMTEAYVMQRFLRPDLLHEAGLDDFDSWAASYGQLVTEVEMAPEGGSFRQTSRFAKFTNVPELLKSWHVFADVKTSEQLQLPTPDIAGGQAEAVVVEASPEVVDYMTELADRADQVRQRRVWPHEDNMLKITGDGNAMALHPQLRGIPTESRTKIHAAAEKIADIHHTHAADTFSGPGGATDPQPGSLQLVFADLGTPNSGAEFTVYDELTRQLAERGVDSNRIYYAQSARNDREKAEMFAAARDGHIAVLIGSTERMGVGTNVQTRAVALHHLDCPWRPADIEQREGRILRQGNQHPQVGVYRYVTADSLDAYRWQTIERKARFISQVKNGSLDRREIDDFGESALSYAEVKALAAGNPRLIEKAEVDAQLHRLERLYRADQREKVALGRDIDRNRSHITALTTERDHAQLAIRDRTSTRGDQFALRTDYETLTNRAEAGRQLLRGAQLHMRIEPAELGRLGGHTVCARRNAETGAREVYLRNVPRSGVTLPGPGHTSMDPAGLCSRLENSLTRLETTAAAADTEIERLQREITAAETSLAQPFARGDELTELRSRAAALVHELHPTSDTEEAHSTAAATADAAAAAEHHPASDQTAPRLDELRPAERAARLVALQDTSRSPGQHRTGARLPGTTPPDRQHADGPDRGRD